MLSETPCAVALIREPRGERDLRHRQVRFGEKLLHITHPALHEIIVRCHSLRLLERTREVIPRQPGYIGQGLHADVLVQVGIDVLAHPLQRPRRQAATDRRPLIGEHQGR